MRYLGMRYQEITNDSGRPLAGDRVTSLTDQMSWRPSAESPKLAVEFFARQR